MKSKKNLRLEEKRARLVRLLLELAALDREEYRKMRAELWKAVARSHNQRTDAQLREWIAGAS